MLIANWWQVLKRAWSIRWIVLAGLLSGVEVFLPIIDGYVDIPSGVFAALSGVATCAAFISRVIVHKGVSDGRVVKGLVNRREMGDATRTGEAELCVSGL